MKSLAGSKVLSALLAVMAIGMGVQTYYLVQVQNQLDDAVASAPEEAEERGKLEKVGPEEVATLTAPDPFTGLEEAETRMRGLFDDFYARFDRDFGSSSFSLDQHPFFTDGDSFLFGTHGVPGPRVDLQDRGDHYEMLVDIPGAEETDVSVRIENNMLTVEGSRNATREESDSGSYMRRERQFGRFERRLPLPADADPTSLHTEYEDGVLLVRLAKRKAADPPSGS